MEWSNEKVLEFIDNYEAEPILWNPRDPNYKKKHLIHDAWLRIKNNLSWPATVVELKKKKDSLMAYYRTHLNKHKKSVISGESIDDVFQTNWFAFSAMNNFLWPIYDSKPIHTQTGENIENQEYIDGEENTSHSTNEENTTSQDSRSIRIGGTKRTKIDMASDISSKIQNQEAYELVKGSMNDECEMFGKLISSKLRKLRNPNNREILMNDIYNMVFRACMIDRVGQTIPVPQSLTNQSSYNLIADHYPTSPSSSSESAQIQPYQLPPDPLLPQSSQQASTLLMQSKTPCQIVKSEFDEISLVGDTEKSTY